MSLLVWLPLNGNLENRGMSSATFNLISGGVTTATNGKTTPNSYIRSNKNTAGYITSNTTFNLDEDFSMCCWCKITDYGTNNSANGIITNHDHTSGGAGITMAYIGASDYRMSFSAGTSSSNRVYNHYYGGTNIYGAWHHLCLTYEKDKQVYRMYVDGKAETITGSYSGGTNHKTHVTFGNTAGARPFNLFDWSTGYSSNANYRPICQLNDVRLYDHCLSTKEIQLIAQGLVAHYKLNNSNNNNIIQKSWNFSGTTGKGTVSLDEKGWYKKSYTHPASTSYANLCEWNAVTTVNANEIYTASFMARSSDSTKNLVVYFFNNDTTGVQVSNITSSQGHNKSGTDGNCTLQLTDKWQQYWITWRFNATEKALTKTLLFRIAKDGGNVEIAKVKLEKGAISTPYGLHPTETLTSPADDCSGYGYHGTTEGTFTYSSDAPRLGNCTIFDGSTNRINLSILPLMKSLLSQQCTINFWVNESDINSRSVYFGGYDGSNFNIELKIGGQLRVYWNNNPDFYSKTASDIVNGVWNMFTIVTDKDSGIKIYQNGVLNKSHNAALADITSSFKRETFCLGADSRSGATMAECKMSDFRIYCTALSAEDVLMLYQSSGSISNLGNLISHEIIEDTINKARIQKTGTFFAQDYSELSYNSDMKIQVLDDGSAWARVFYHDNQGGSQLFTSYAEIMNTDSTYKYSKLNALSNFIGKDNKYEFMLTYPTDLPNQYNRWKQTNLPQDTWMGTEDGTLVVTGYEAIHIDWDTRYWGGLGRQNQGAQTISSTFINGSIGHSNWFYAIGATSPHDGGIPGPNQGIQQVELWVRLDTLKKKKNFSIIEESYILSSRIQEN